MHLPENLTRSHRAMLAFVTLGVLALGLLSSSHVAWARPALAPDSQTVPTVAPTSVTLPPVQPTTEPEPGGPALQAEKRASVSNVVPGGTFTYTISVRNAGDAASGPLAVRDTLPATLEIVDARTSVGQITQDGQTVVVSLDSLPAGAELILEIDVLVRADTPAGAVIENQFELEHAGSLWMSPMVAVSLPPAQLPVTGGA